VKRADEQPLLLDVGCANGDFPRYMAAQGWRVEGVETSDSSARIQDFKVYTQQFSEIPVAAPAYDAVTAWAVLEHVHDPMSYFQKAAAILKKGGIFVFLVQNFASVASRHLFCEDVPRHLYFFDRHTIRRYLETAGLQLEKEDNNRKIYKMAPYNWVAYHFKTYVLRQKFTHGDIPLTHREFVKVHNLRRGLGSMLKHAAYAPASVADRMLWPLIENVQILRKTYGISTFVARKP
jgi:2-polyprenyl-3-methyl-5-hydroxy-6-metoxy-1,4-benzoquinol methylase